MTHMNGFLKSRKQKESGRYLELFKLGKRDIYSRNITTSAHPITTIKKIVTLG